MRLNQSVRILQHSLDDTYQNTTLNFAPVKSIMAYPSKILPSVRKLPIRLY